MSDVFGDHVHNILGTEITTSGLVSIIYSVVSLIIFVVVCIYGWKRLKRRDDYKDLKGCKRYTSWLSTVWKMKGIYLSALVHIYDIATDIGIIVNWGYQAFAEENDKTDVRGINMMGLWASSMVAFLLYRFISAGFVYEFTGKLGRACVQFLDLEIYRAIYITHTLGREEAGNLQRWLQKFEAIFESALQSLLQLVYIVKTADYSPLIMSSIVLSFFSVAARFTSDDRIFFVKGAERLGLRLQRRFEKGREPTDEDEEDDEDEEEHESDESSDDEEEEQKHDIDAAKQKSQSASLAVDGEEEEALATGMANKQNVANTNKLIKFASLKPNSIKFQYTRQHGSFGAKEYTQCKIQTAKTNPNTKHKPKTLDKINWSTKIVAYEEKSNAGNVYSLEMLEAGSDYMMRLKFCGKDGNTPWTETFTFTTPLFSRWKVWNYVGYNRAYLFRYSFRMCDVFSRLMILALVWCTLSGTLTFFILVFEAITVVIYAQQIKKYNFFQFLVATYFSEENRNQTVSYCLFRRIESLVYLVIVTYVILFTPKYNNDRTINCVKDYDTVAQCQKDTLDDRTSDCDCRLYDEVYATKILFTLAWAFANLSGDVFFGAFHSMRKKFGTNERNIVNVMQKRDWDAFSEMLQFGYRMNRFDEKSQRSGLSTFLDRIPSHKFDYEEVESMIRLGANANDQSIKPQDEKDNDVADQVGDNILIRYVKVTPCDKINQQFEDVVKTWTTTGITGGDYRQNPSRIRVAINTKNENGYTAFHVYWEKIQYQRREKRMEKKHIKQRKEHHKSDHDGPEEKMKINFKVLQDEKENKAWFKHFYEMIKKWQELGADMSTVSEDGICPLMAYIRDLDSDDIEMDTVRLLCPIDGCSVVTTDDEEEEKHQLISMETMVQSTDKEHFLEIEIRENSFKKWFNKHDFSERMFKVSDIKIWHELGATGDINKVQPLLKYLVYMKPEDQRKDDIDILIECGCSMENQDAKSRPSQKPMTITTIIDNVFQSRAVLNLDIIEYLHDQYGLPIETIGNDDFEDVWDKNQYETQLYKYIRCHASVTVDNIQRMIKKGYMFCRNRARARQCIKEIVNSQTELPFDVLQLLLDLYYVESDDQKESGDEDEEDDEAHSDDDDDEYYDGNHIFNGWIKSNKNITFEQIEILIKKYNFSPYRSGESRECSVHYIWNNDDITFAVAHKYWLEYGVSLFGKFEGLYRGFILHFLEYQNITELEEMKLIEAAFLDVVGKVDDNDNTILHFYLENSHLDTDMLRYLALKYKHLAQHPNYYGITPLHKLCGNGAVKMEHLSLFVKELNVPLTIRNHRGIEALDALLGRSWNKQKMVTIIHEFNVDFSTDEPGDHILYKICQQGRFSVEALIYLYKHWKRTRNIDLNGPAFKSKLAVQQWRGRTAPGRTMLLHLATNRRLTPSQMTRLVDDIGLDITATDDDNVGILHIMAKESLTAIMLRTVANLMKKQQGETFAIDAPDKRGTTPFQKWLYSVKRNVGDYMDVVDVWDELGADITQTDGSSANNMLHHYLTGSPSLIRLAYLRKMCFDDINPWKSEEQDDGQGVVYKKRKLGAFQAPMHARPVPSGRSDGTNTLFKMYMESVVGQNAPVNINVLEYFRSKRKDGVRMITDDTTSPLWQYVKHKNVKLDVLKYLVDDLGCVLKPKPDDRIVFTYIEYQCRRKQLQLDVLDYFYGLGKKECDFMFAEKSLSILHKYVKKTGSAQPFNCAQLETFVERYKLESLIKRDKEEKKEEEDRDYGSAAAKFYQDRTSEITADIVTCFTKLGFDITEAISFKTPLQIYCDAESSRYSQKYVLKSIVRAFIASGADVNYRIDDKQAVSMCEILSHGKISCLKMMVETFAVELVNTKKRTKDPWYQFMDDYDSDKLNAFVKLATIYAAHKCDPLHLIHSERDGDHRIQLKFYRISDETKFDADEEKEFAIKKNQKKLKTARKYLHRLVVVADRRAALFRDCRLIARLSSKDTTSRIKIPQKWLEPIGFSELMDALPKLQMKIKESKQILPEKRLAQSLVIIDMKTIDQIHTSLSEQQEEKDVEEQGSNADDEDSKKKKKANINDIQLRGENNILTKYIRSNHTSAISVSDIKKMQEYAIDFTHTNDDDYHALTIYCRRSKGIIAKPIVEALIEAGCAINRPPSKEDDNKDKDGDHSDHSDSDSDSSYYGSDDLDDEDEDGKPKKKKPKVIYEKTPLHHYCGLIKCDLDGFRTLIECGADVTLGYGDTDATALYCAFTESDHIDAAFIEYINSIDTIDVTGAVSEYNERLLFNEYLRFNSKVNQSTVSAFVKVAGCDANSADNENDTNSIKSYISNEHLKFNMAIIGCLASLGANINEADNDGLYPIQHILQLDYTPLAKLLQRVRQMVEFGAKLRHVLSDDEVVIEDNKLYILHDMKEGYERFNGCWCRTYSYEREVRRREKERVQCVVVVTQYRNITFGEGAVNRENIKNVTLQMLIERDPAFKGMEIDEDDEEEQQKHMVEEEEQQQQE